MADYYPFWGFPLALIFAEIANHSRRRKRIIIMIIAAIISLTLFALGVWYLAYNGYTNTRPTLKKLEQTYF